MSRDAGGDLVVPDDRPDLQYQPHSALITCEPGENVLLRFANLGFKEAAMTLTGIKLRVVGRDATLLRGRDGWLVVSLPRPDDVELLPAWLGIPPADASPWDEIEAAVGIHIA